MKILTICGSLRETSSNSGIILAAMKLYPQHQWEKLDISKFPFFEPEIQFAKTLPAVILRARKMAASCDLIFIATPEYAHGIPGVLKNALEWIFHEGTQKKNVLIVIGSAQGEFARDQLVEVLATMDFSIRKDDVLIIKGARAKVSSSGEFLDQNIVETFMSFCGSAMVSKST